MIDKSIFNVKLDKLYDMILEINNKVEKLDKRLTSLEKIITTENKLKIKK
jgi:hypothetical protein